VLLCPVASVPASVTANGRGRSRGAVEYLDAWRHTQWFNALACPAAVPVGRSPEGLPIGVQIVARPFQDEIALGVARLWMRRLGIDRSDVTFRRSGLGL